MAFSSYQFLGTVVWKRLQMYAPPPPPPNPLRSTHHVSCTASSEATIPTMRRDEKNESYT